MTVTEGAAPVAVRAPAQPDAGFDTLARSNRPACLGLARHVLRDHHLAEDAVQEALLDAWRLEATYDADRCSEQGWLLTLTRRRAVDRVRAEQRRAARHLGADEAAQLADPGAGPEEEGWRAARATALRGALALLTPAQYDVVVLAYFGGYTQLEIAGLVGIPLGTVKTRTVAALRRLRGLLESSCADAL